MASPSAIAAVSEGIRRLLDDACPRGEAPFRGAEVAVFAAADFDAQNPQRQIVKVGITLFLYRVAVNGPQRNRAARVDANGQRLRPSLPVDLYYLLTPWGESTGKQHRLLGWAMRTLEDAAILPAGLLNALRPEHDTFLPSETVELIADQLSLQDQSGLWQALRAPMQLSVGYIARMVPIDSVVPVSAAGPVEERGFDMHVRSDP